MGVSPALRYLFFFLIDPPTTEIYPLPLHDALPICAVVVGQLAIGRDLLRRRVELAVFDQGLHHRALREPLGIGRRRRVPGHALENRTRGIPIAGDRKSTRLNSSHLVISYAVFCLKK